MKKRLAVILLGLIGFGAAFIGCVSAASSTSSVCMTQPGLVEPGYAVAGKSTTYTEALNNNFSEKLSQIQGISGDLRLAHIYFNSSDGMTDLGFLTKVEATMTSDANSGLADIVASEYVHSDPYAAVGPSIDVVNRSNSGNLYDFINAGQFRILVKVTGVMPIDAWSIDVTFCFEFSANYKASVF